MGSGDTTYSPELPEDVIIEVPLSTSITVTFACGIVAPEGSLIVPATLPASFWAQTLSVSSNKNKQMETIRNRRSIGLLSSSLFGSISGELNLRSFTLIGPECKGSVLLYRPSWHTPAPRGFLRPHQRGQIFILVRRYKKIHAGPDCRHPA